jgi:hypothetical protein
MILYCVEIAIAATIESDWLDWMKRVHVPDVLRTDCFSECRIFKVIDGDKTEVVYVLQYECRSLEDYRRYRQNFAPALQKEHSDRFAGQFRGARQFMEEVTRIPARPG